MPGLDAAAPAADSTACCSTVGKHTGVVSSILGASLELAQHRYNKSTLYSREETTEREYCCKKSLKEISTGSRSQLGTASSGAGQFPELFFQKVL